MTFKVRDLLVRQRTQTINALRGHLMEYGLVVAQGMQNVPRLRQLIETHPDLPETARNLSFGLLQHIESLTDKINALEQDLRTRARQDEVASRLTTIPGIGAICATTMEALAPRRRPFPSAVILRRGSGSRLNRTRPEARSVWERHRKWGSGICGCSSLELRPSSAGEATRSAGWYLAGKNASDETAKADCSRSGQQIGAYRLGSHGPRGRLRSSGPWPCLTQQPEVARRRECGEV